MQIFVTLFENFIGTMIDNIFKIFSQEPPSIKYFKISISRVNFNGLKVYEAFSNILRIVRIRLNN